eukprot:TRINITY_DN99045_c0_g1_i1.p1 TRINITY_DN99045_c0_g1~~TRINITY_DN99045_c0_g1_i1.p1  ORF type:complete len:206 (-),score=52.17 TRINITY_DN99045_c0_g1_i1:55-651(-)
MAIRDGSLATAEGDELLHATAQLKAIDDEEFEDLRLQVSEFIAQLPPREGREVLERLMRRLAAGEPLSARKVSDRVDESCEFLAELLAFCQGGPDMLAEVLQGAARKSIDDQAQLLSRFLDSRRRRRLDPVRCFGPWEEHFASDGARYFYNNATQRTQWQVPEDWVEPEQAEAVASSPDLVPAGYTTTAAGVHESETT